MKQTSVKDAESKTGKWRPVLSQRQCFFLTSQPIPKRHFRLRAVGRGLRMYEDTKGHNSI